MTSEVETKFDQSIRGIQEQIVEDIILFLNDIFAYDAFVAGTFVRNVLLPRKENVASTLVNRVDCYFPDNAKRSEFIDKYLKENKLTDQTIVSNGFILLGRYGTELALIICHLRNEIKITVNIDPLGYQNNEFKYIENDGRVVNLGMYDDFKKRILNKEIKVYNTGYDRMKKDNDLSVLLPYMKERYTIELCPYNDVSLVPFNALGYQVKYGIDKYDFVIVNENNINHIFRRCMDCIDHHLAKKSGVPKEIVNKPVDKMDTVISMLAEIIAMLKSSNIFD